MTSYLYQCISVKTQNQINHCDETKKEYSWLIPNCNPGLKETTSWTTLSQAKDIASRTNPLVKVLCRGRHWNWGPTRRRAIKEWSIAINRGWVNNQACSLPHNIWIISYSFIMVNKLSELLRTIWLPNNFFLFCKLSHHKILVLICLNRVYFDVFFSGK